MCVCVVSIVAKAWVAAGQGQCRAGAGAGAGAEQLRRGSAGFCPVLPEQRKPNIQSRKDPIHQKVTATRGAGGVH